MFKIKRLIKQWNHNRNIKNVNRFILYIENLKNLGLYEIEIDPGLNPIQFNRLDKLFNEIKPEVNKLGGTIHGQWLNGFRYIIRFKENKHVSK